MIDILLLLPEGGDFDQFSCLDEHGYRCTRVRYGKEPDIDQIVQADLIFLVLIGNVDRSSGFLSRFRSRDTYTPVLIARPMNLSRADAGCLLNGCDSIVDINANEVCFLHRIDSLLNRVYLKPHRVYYFEDGITLDAELHCLTKNDRIVHLGAKLFRVIEFLACHPGLYFTAAQLLERIGTPSDSKSLSSLRMQIVKLRKVIRESGGRDIISSSYGKGYCITRVKISAKREGNIGIE